jgi:hypothetical protein
MKDNLPIAPRSHTKGRVRPGTSARSTLLTQQPPVRRDDPAGGDQPRPGARRKPPLALRRLGHELGERRHRNALGVQALPHGTRDLHGIRGVAVQAERGHIHLEVRTVGLL